ncbi:hypothetical protein F4802DRAFT_458923 [Xylaria palmicola]|nr:hypothetical protein F4802DRAFT_458923 [Xylaria palmicola]
MSAMLSLLRLPRQMIMCNRAARQYCSLRLDTTSVYVYLTFAQTINPPIHNLATSFTITHPFLPRTPFSRCHHSWPIKKMLYAMLGPAKPKKKVTFHRPAIAHAPKGSRSWSGRSESACAEVGTDNQLDEVISARAKHKANRKMSTTEDLSDTEQEWTREEDRIICIRKSEAKTWADIGKELDRPRRECQHRHRVLASRAKELGITTTKLAKLYVEDDEEGVGKKRSKDKGKKKSKSVVTDDESEQEQQQKKGKGKETNKSTASKTKSNSKKKMKKHSSGAGSETSDPDDDDDDDDDDNQEAAEEQEGEYGDTAAAEYWEERRYLYDVRYGALYPDRKALRPDRFYSESDCRVLAGLEARHRALKWLHIQADFRNATGRMVEADMLRAKFYEE